jgi:hypothetical protein
MNAVCKKCITLLLYITLSQYYCLEAAILVPEEYPTIQLAIDQANPFDTIYVDPGIYYENLVIQKPLFLISKSVPDSVIIHDVERAKGPHVIIIDAEGPGAIIGFKIKGYHDTNGSGILCNYSNWEIKNCYFIGHQLCINSSQATTKIYNNTFTEYDPDAEYEPHSDSRAISLGGDSEVAYNFFTEIFEGIVVSTSSNTKIFNNLIIDCIYSINCNRGDDLPLSDVFNNVITTNGTRGSQQYGINVGKLANIRNNIISFCGREGVQGHPENTTFHNNNVYMNTDNYSGGFRDRTGVLGNISLDQLFCDNERMYYLASNSPCIDAGDLLLTDLDNTRSDMGLYGGPYSNDLRYSPSSFNLLSPMDKDVVTDNTINFKWEKSFDRDANDEIKYRVIIGKKKSYYEKYARIMSYRIDGIIDTFYTTNNWLKATNVLSDYGIYYWSVEAIDLTGLYKKAIEINEIYYYSNMYFILGQNYPNPFNSQTTIPINTFTNNDISLQIFNILGQKVYSNTYKSETEINNITINTENWTNECL